MAQARGRHQLQRPNRSLLISVVVISTLIVLSAIVYAVTRDWGSPKVASVEVAQSQENQQSAPPAEPPQSDPEPVPDPEPVTFTIVAGGDILTHIPVLESAWNGERYDLSELMSPTAAYIQGSDLALCHMEVPLAALGAAPTGYPLFSAPYETAAELAEAGWDGCSTASNHSVDFGFEGLARTLDGFDETGLGHAGTARSPEEAGLPQMYQIEKGGQTLTVAHISFANNLNGNPLPADQPWSINLNDVSAVLEQARLARENGADLVIVSYHCCELEYVAEPESLQVDTANTLAASGLVDIMISHHAHVPKPMAHLEGGPTGQGMWVTYGTGNFISNQSEHCCVPQSATGIISFFEVVKDSGGVVTVPAAQWSAVTTERLNGHYVRVITAGGAEGSPVPIEETQWRHQLTLDVMGTGPATERTDPPQDPGVVTVLPRFQ